MHISHTIKFMPHIRTRGQIEHLSVRMRVTLHSQPPCDFPLGYYIDLDKWDSDAQRAIGGNNMHEINRTIREWTSIMDEIFARYELIEKRVPNIGEVKELFNDMIGKPTRVKNALTDEPDEYADFFRVFGLFTETIGMKNQWTDSTFEKFDGLQNHLKQFAKEEKIQLTFTNLTEQLLQRYVLHLSYIPMRNTTISKNLAFLRWFLRWASNAGYYKGNLHETFKPKLKGTDGNAREKIYLTRDELLSVYNHQFEPSQDALERVRDVFVFCCFTGLRYSDVAKLKRSDWHGTTIRVVTKKTVDGLTIELNDYSLAILNKYKEQSFPNDLVLPVISNEKMNQHLKDIGKVCGLDEPTRIVYFVRNERHEEVYPKWALLTTHVGRHTFIVTALLLGIGAEVIMKWTGHSDYESMKPYIAIVDELKEMSMSRFNKLDIL